ncbi:nuclear transport factor 2 family protein [Mycolicibacter senuensis]|uniref:nuclear transport factor 2 family protein n=1 Tax=Mycolicibacter senuensis TaxID=386913 RepID=UPI000DCC2576|nr:nuclear transport factor 2 family protein [Mycolicibacter senuensis]RAV02814.1 nuclear transport factor 2 family protein [Mycolicibacter senuensis]
MTLDELIARENVRDTYARYNHAGDRGQLEQLSACFSEDGILEVKGGFTARGRGEIVAALSDLGPRVARTDTPPPGAHHIVRHYVANLLFTAVHPERIETQAYFVVFQVDAADHWGRYRDVLVPVGDRWLFAHRRVSVDGKRPGSTA